MAENLPAKTQTKPTTGNKGKPSKNRKEIRFELAKEFLRETQPLSSDELAELNRIYPESDRKIGCYIYSLRTRKKCNKAKIMKILSMDHKTLDRFMGTISLSQFLSLSIEEWISKADETLAHTAPDVPDGLDFHERTDYKRMHAMEQMIDAIVYDPTKIFDAGLEELSNAYEKIHKIHRLENNQSTDNRVNIIKNDPESLKQNQLAQAEIMQMAARLNQVIKSNEQKAIRADEQIAATDTTEGIRVTQVTGE